LDLCTGRIVSALQLLRAAHLAMLPGGGQVRVFNDETRESCWSMAMDVADLAGV
jgi:hypothetical protein